MKDMDEGKLRTQIKNQMKQPVEKEKVCRKEHKSQWIQHTWETRGAAKET